MHVLPEGAAPPSARRVLTVPEAETIIGGSLSRPSKMPCPAWGISERECRRGSRLSAKPGTVCSACYARRGHYLGPSVIAAHARRLAALAHPLWSEAMAFLINAYAQGGHFRWFDSGDLQSPAHLDMILWVARRTPTVSHWLPTRETGIVRPRLADIPSNLTVRVSADVIGRAPRRAMGLPSSTVHRNPGLPVRIGTSRRNDSIECLAYLRGHRCGTCRACWSPKVGNVSYLLNAGLRSAGREAMRVHLAVLP
jgi:hypothetical protein